MGHIKWIYIYDTRMAVQDSDQYVHVYAHKYVLINLFYSINRILENMCSVP